MEASVEISCERKSRSCNAKVFPNRANSRLLISSSTLGPVCIFLFVFGKLTYRTRTCSVREGALSGLFCDRLGSLRKV